MDRRGYRGEFGSEDQATEPQPLPRRRRWSQLGPRWRQQLGGLVAALVGGALSVWTWYTAVYEGYYYDKASVIFPAFCILGLALVAFPGYREERLARGEDISALSGVRLITRRWWTILVVALAAGFANYALLSST